MDAAGHPPAGTLGQLASARAPSTRLRAHLPDVVSATGRRLTLPIAGQLGQPTDTSLPDGGPPGADGLLPRQG